MNLGGKSGSEDLTHFPMEDALVTRPVALGLLEGGGYFGHILGVMEQFVSVYQSRIQFRSVAGGKEQSAWNTCLLSFPFKLLPSNRMTQLPIQ